MADAADPTPPAEVRLLYVTVPDMETGLGIGRILVEDRLAACANAWPSMRSIYWWKGEVEESEEAVLIVKTTAELAESARAAIVNEHPYETPCVIDLPVVGGSEPYLQWIRAEARGSASD